MVSSSISSLRNSEFHRWRMASSRVRKTDSSSLAADQRGVGFGRFKNRAAAGFLGKQDLRDIKQRIDARDLMDFLADEVDGLGIRRDGGPHAFRRRCLFDMRGGALRRSSRFPPRPWNGRRSPPSRSRRRPRSALAVIAARRAIVAVRKSVLGLLLACLSPVARAHAGPSAKLDRRLLNGSVSESLTKRSLKSDFGNDKLRLHQNIGAFSGHQKIQNPPGRAFVAG